MSLKTLFSAGLLAFVAISLVAAVIDVAGLRSRSSQFEHEEAAVDERLTAYYFHTNTRCTTCRAIEAHARDALASQVEAGKLDWRVVNYEEAGNRHYASEFKLLCPSVVLVERRGGAVVRWKNLERVWELNEERDESIAYVQTEWTAFQESQR